MRMSRYLLVEDLEKAGVRDPVNSRAMSCTQFGRTELFFDNLVSALMWLTFVPLEDADVNWRVLNLDDWTWAN